MSKRRSGAETRLVIMDACEQILLASDLSALTLESAAQVAGLSKGGLLYHFPNKIALIDALIRHILDRFNQRIAELVATIGRGNQGIPEAYLRASLEQALDPRDGKILSSLFAAGERYTSAQAIFQEYYEQWQAQIESAGMEPKLAMLLRLVADGMWYVQINQFAPPDAETRAQLVTYVLSLIEDETA